MRREDRERSFGDSPQHSRTEDEAQPGRPVAAEERVKSGPTSDEPRKTPNTPRQPGRLPLPD
jgi:hypothetical protein